jgi:hypothetical protein
VLAAAAGAVAAAGHIAVLITGAIVTAWSAWLALPPSSRPWPVVPLTASLLLAAGLWLVTTIAGSEGLSLAAVPWLPLSPPAERLLAAWLLGAAWAFSGLWPLRQPVDGVLTAPVGASLIVRLGAPAAAAGLEHWRAAAVPLVLLGLWHAAVTRRLTALAIGGAFLGVASVRPAGVSGAGWLLACAAGLELQRLLSAETARRLEPVVRMLLAFAAAWGAQQVLTAGLETEVVYSVFAAIAAVFGLNGSCHESSARDGRPALTPPRGRAHIWRRDEISRS